MQFSGRPLDISLSGPLQRLRSPTLGILAAMATICMMILALELWYEHRERTVEIAEARKAAFNLARSLAQHADDTFEMADITLLGIAERLRVDGVSPSALDRLSRFLRTNVASNTRIRGLFVYDSAGAWIANSLPATPPNVNNSDRDYFQHFQNGTDDGLYIGRPVRSRSGGEWIVTLARRFEKPDGSFGGVVLATIDADYFAQLYSTFDVGRAGSLILASASGRIFARYPQNERFVDRDLGGTELFRSAMPRGWSGTTQSKSPLDGVVRIIGYQAGTRFPITVLSAVSEEEALAEWRSSALSRVIVTGLMLLVILILGSFLLAYIRRHRAAELALTTLSRTDALTALCNRRAFDEKLANEWSRCGREGTPLSLILFDLDRFKIFNDSYGHQAGDECLRRTAEVVKLHARRPSDMAARYGGEELAVLLPGTDKAGARLVAENIRRDIARLAIPHASNEPSGVVTVSGGVAEIAGVPSAAALIERADTALYEAKRTGRDRIVATVEIREFRLAS